MGMVLWSNVQLIIQKSLIKNALNKNQQQIKFWSVNYNIWFFALQKEKN